MKIVAVLCTLLALAAATPASARTTEQLVEIAPTRGGMGGTRSPQPLLGYLLRPTGADPHAAVVVLHGCDGFGLIYLVRGRELQHEGYVVLVLDSLGAVNACAGGGGAMAEALDAYAALGWLDRQGFVDPARVALLGFSMGGVAALIDAQSDLLAATFKQHFRAAVAYYPQCQWSSGVMALPTLILIGGGDDWAPAEDCEAMLRRRAGKGAAVTLRVFPGASHAFDSPAPPHWELGHFIQFDPGATVAARAQTGAFLREWLSTPSAASSGQPVGPTAKLR